MKLFDNLESWFTHSAWPALKPFFAGVVRDEVAVLAPIAQGAVARLTTEESTALATGNSANTGHILAAVVRDTTAAAQAAGINAGVHSILAAVGGAVPAKTS